MNLNLTFVAVVFFLACALHSCAVGAFQQQVIVSRTQSNPMINSQNGFSRLTRIAPRPTTLMMKGLKHPGDDMRWTTRLIRRLRRLNEDIIRGILPEKNTFDRQEHKPRVRQTVTAFCFLMYIYQAITATLYLRNIYPTYWFTEPFSVMSDVLLDQSIKGPVTRDFMFAPQMASRQPHRYFTSGFLHSGLPHLLINMVSLRNTPDWLETGLGWRMFLSTYLVGIVSGNYMFTQNVLKDGGVGAFKDVCIGASGGIAALYGLMFIALSKMANGKTGKPLRSMFYLLVWGTILPDISNASHIGGFIGGTVMGFLFSPGYTKSYSMYRKNSLAVDNAPEDFRQAMGFGKVPGKDSLLPLSFLWIGAVVGAMYRPGWLSIPVTILRGLLRPGSLSSLRL